MSERVGSERAGASRWQRRTRIPLCAGLSVVLLVCLPARAGARGQGETLWRTPAGLARLTTTKAGRVLGTLETPNAGCALEAGAKVVDGWMKGGNFTGKLRICLEGCAEAGDPAFAFAMLVRRGPRLSGAVHVKAPPGCRAVGLTEKGGVVLEATSAKTAAPEASAAETRREARPPDEEAYDPRRYADVRTRAMELASVGAAYLEKGRFTLARKKFQEAVHLDPTYAEGYNGIGVTFAVENDFERAIEWYQRSIAANPDIGDAYYNLACAYARTGKPKLAVNFLRIAVLNGYAQADQIAADPDLEPLHARPDFKAILKLARVGEAQAP